MELSDEAMRLRIELKVRDALKRGHRQFNISMDLVSEGSFVKLLLTDGRKFNRKTLKRAYSRLHLLDKPVPITNANQKLLAS